MNFAGFCVAGGLIASAIFWTTPRYQISNSGHDAMRIDTRTGEVSFCKAIAIDEAPVCSDFGSRSLEQYQAERRAAAPQTQPTSQPPTSDEDLQKWFNDLMNDKGKTQAN